MSLDERQRAELGRMLGRIVNMVRSSSGGRTGRAATLVEIRDEIDAEIRRLRIGNATGTLRSRYAAESVIVYGSHNAAPSRRLPRSAAPERTLRHERTDRR